MKAHGLWTRLSVVVFVTTVWGLHATARESDRNVGPWARWCMDECSGITVGDCTGHGYDGTLYATATWAAGVSGCGVQFVDYGSVDGIPSSVDDSFQNAFTITAWVFWYGPSGYHPLCYLFDARGPEVPCASGFIVYLDSDGRFHFHLKVPPGQGLDHASLSAIPLNTWTHVAAVFDHGTQTVTIYLNGVADNVIPATTLYYGTSLAPSIGNNRWSPPYAPFNGVVDELRLYDWALGPDAVQPLYCLYAVRGDMNCDCELNFDDINAFVLALSDPAAYRSQYPGCDYLKGDLDGDGFVTFLDINPFVDLLSGGK